MKRDRKSTSADLPDGWKETVIAAYAKGSSDVEVKRIIRKMRGSLSNDLWDRWIREEPEFNEVITAGRELSEAWWCRVGRLGAVGKVDVNPAVWIFNMKNRFGWKDAKSLDVNGHIHQTVEHRAVQAIDTRITELLGDGQTGDSAPARTH